MESDQGTTSENLQCKHDYNRKTIYDECKKCGWMRPIKYKS